MLTPYGQPGNHIEKVMLLGMWANQIGKEKSSPVDLKQKFIFAGLGKPTYPVHHHTIAAHKKYWEKIEAHVDNWHNDPEVSDESCAIGYGDPHGDEEAKEIMADAMSKWYQTTIEPNNVLFTIGGLGGLRIIFEVLNSFYAEKNKYRVITPFPHYSAYSNNPHHLLHPIEVMKENGYQLTASALENSIKSAISLAETDEIFPKAILICNPSNPLGTIISEEELKKIAVVLRKYDYFYIILDEAYAEMNFIEMPSFLRIAPDLKNRTIILRSATKSLSAAGERMAIILAFENRLISELVNKKITSYIHAPISSQIAYAETMNIFSSEDRYKMSSFYKNKVDYVLKRLKDMGAEMPSPNYKVEGTFYALGDFSDLLGMEIPIGAKMALEKTGFARTGEDIVYSLLFKDSLMVAPLSYFGLQEECGFLRITCSANSNELRELMNRLENRLYEERYIKNKFLKNKILSTIKRHNGLKEQRYQELITKITKNQLNHSTCKTLKHENNELLSIYKLYKMQYR